MADLFLSPTSMARLVRIKHLASQLLDSPAFQNPGTETTLGGLISSSLCNLEDCCHFINTSAPISRLSDDVLALIFITSQDSMRYDHSLDNLDYIYDETRKARPSNAARIIISHVCGTGGVWRSTPRFCGRPLMFLLLGI